MLINYIIFINFYYNCMEKYCIFLYVFYSNGDRFYKCLEN